MMNILQNVICRRVLSRREPPAIRTLFTQDSLGITAYIAYRDLEHTYNPQPEQFTEEFRSRVYLTVPLNFLVEDMKKYVHLMSNRNDDIELLWKALRLYKTKCEQWQSKSQVDIKKDYTFGPTTMRALSYHNAPEYAIKFFEDGNITELFDQLTTYQILLDLLYDRRMYVDVLRIYAEIHKRIKSNNQFVPSAINAIVFATYYRLNTPFHDDLAYDMYKALQECGQHSKQYRKSIALVAAMRNRRHQFEESLQILSICDNIDVNIRYVRILSHVYSNQFDEAFRLLEMTIASPHTDQVIKIPDELLQKIENRLKKYGDADSKQKYELIHNELKRLERIFYKSLDDVLCARFPTKMAPYKPGKKFGVGSF